MSLTLVPRGNLAWRCRTVALQGGAAPTGACASPLLGSCERTVSASAVLDSRDSHRLFKLFRVLGLLRLLRFHVRLSAEVCRLLLGPCCVFSGFPYSGLRWPLKAYWAIPNHLYLPIWRCRQHHRCSRHYHGVRGPPSPPLLWPGCLGSGPDGWTCSSSSSVRMLCDSISTPHLPSDQGKRSGNAFDSSSLAPERDGQAVVQCAAPNPAVPGQVWLRKE